MLWKCCIQYARKSGKLREWPQDWKKSVIIPIPKKGNAKECSNYCTIALISHASKVMLKILQVKLQEYVNCELPHVQDRFRKVRGTRDQIANIYWITEKAREFQKTHTSALLTSQSLWLYRSQQTGKFFKRWEYYLTCLLRNLYAGQEATVRTGHGTTDWFQIGKGVCQGCILSLAYLTYMQSTSR